MAAYVIADVKINDSTGYEEYRKIVGASVNQYGGKFLVVVGGGKGGKCEALEGDWCPDHLVVVEFESFEQAMAWYKSPEYIKVKEIRQNSADTNFILAEQA